MLSCRCGVFNKLNSLCPSLFRLSPLVLPDEHCFTFMWVNDRLAVGKWTNPDRFSSWIVRGGADNVGVMPAKVSHCSLMFRASKSKTDCEKNTSWYASPRARQQITQYTMHRSFMPPQTTDEAALLCKLRISCSAVYYRPSIEARIHEHGML